MVLISLFKDLQRNIYKFINMKLYHFSVFEKDSTSYLFRLLSHCIKGCGWLCLILLDSKLVSCCFFVSGILEIFVLKADWMFAIFLSEAAHKVGGSCRVHFPRTVVVTHFLVEGFVETFKTRVVIDWASAVVHFVHISQVPQATCLFRVKLFARENGPWSELT